MDFPAMRRRGALGNNVLVCVPGAVTTLHHRRNEIVNLCKHRGHIEVVANAVPTWTEPHLVSREHLSDQRAHLGVRRRTLGGSDSVGTITVIRFTSVQQHIANSTQDSIEVFCAIRVLDQTLYVATHTE